MTCAILKNWHQLGTACGKLARKALKEIDEPELRRTLELLQGEVQLPSAVACQLLQKKVEQCMQNSSYAELLSIISPFSKPSQFQWDAPKVADLSVSVTKKMSLCNET
eukprot:6479183-Amphidinium_carterae.1